MLLDQSSMPSMRLESALNIRSDRIERHSAEGDSHRFYVELTHSNGSREMLENHLDSRENSSFLSLQDDDLRPPRRFYKEKCRAELRWRSPTALSTATTQEISDLKCSTIDDQIPIPVIADVVHVLGSNAQDLLQCHMVGGLCSWDFPYESQEHPALQASALGFLSVAMTWLKVTQVDPHLPDLTAYAESSDANQSLYDAESHRLIFGTGKYPDALDGFVVIHEWTHALVDTLNPKLWGYQASVLHEALADFVPSKLFESSCFAPYDAQQIPGRSCIRDLSLHRVYPKDLRFRDPHSDSIVLSGALWEARHILGRNFLELISETLIRLPKNPQLRGFWAKLIEVYHRQSNAERDSDSVKELRAIGVSHGL